MERVVVAPDFMLKSTSASAVPWSTSAPPTTMTPTRAGLVAGYRPPWVPVVNLPLKGLPELTSTLS